MRLDIVPTDFADLDDVPIRAGDQGMKLAIVTSMLSAMFLTAPAVAASYQEAIDGLMRASYKYMKLTYACRNVTGLSPYRDAHVAAENAARATGMPTDLAMSTVAKMASNITAAPPARIRPGLNDCAADVARTKREFLIWRTKFRRSQQ